MSRKSRILEAEKFESARSLEAAGENLQAIKAYHLVLKKNPLHTAATSRLLILYRKEKNIQAEITLLKDSLSAHENHNAESQREWISEHKKIAEDSRPLAKMLGMLGPDELPFYAHEILQKWKRRIAALEKRVITNAAKSSAANRPGPEKAASKTKNMKDQGQNSKKKF
jgi:hypothetical protein